MNKSPICSIPKEDLEKFRKFLSSRLGLHFPKENERELESKLVKIAKTLGIDDLTCCLKFLTEINLTKKHIVALAKDLSVGETYFFRHEQTFQALEKNILPEIIAKKKEKDKKIRIWCAACCTGEEPYSVAILLKRLIYGIENWEIEILGTDINLEFLEKARSGIYKEWSFRNTPLKVKEENFKQKGTGNFELKNDILKMVKFDYLNLIDESYPCFTEKLYEMDLILCNNVLIYFTHEVIPKIIDRFSKTLNEGGWLIVSTVEAPFVEHPSFASKKIGDVYLFKKDSHCKPKNAKATQKTPEKVQKTKVGLKRAPLQFQTLETTKPKGETPKKEQASELHPNESQSYKTTLVLEKELISLGGKNEFLQERKGDLTRLVLAFANQGEIAKAMEWCKLSLRIHSLDPMLVYFHGMLLQETGLIEEALQAYKKCLFLDPSFVMCHFSIGGICLLMNEEKNAKKHFRNVLELLKSFDAEDILPGTDDLTVERIQVITENLMKENNIG